MSYRFEVELRIYSESQSVILRPRLIVQEYIDLVEELVINKVGKLKWTMGSENELAKRCSLI